MAINKKMEDLIFEAMEKELKIEVSERYDKYKKELIEKLDRDKDNVVAGITLHVMKMIKVERNEQEIVLTLKTDKFT